MGGFTYNGIHSSTYNVQYVPGPPNRWLTASSYSVYKSDIAWKHGGYYYGSKENIREIQLKCWFDQITTKQREQIRKWLGRDTSGTLILDELPFVYWKVRPVKQIEGQLYNDNQDGTLADVYSGTFNIVFNAFDPFGYLTRKYNTGSEQDNANDYCDLLPQNQMPAAPTTSSRSFQVYNPGTEKCGLRIIIGGTATRTFRFLNTTNLSRCVLTGLPTSSLVLDVRGDTGLITTHYPSGTTGEEKNWSYHDGGFITLNPGLNTINIQEKVSDNTWVTPTGLSLNHISIDYAPRIL